MDKDRDGRIAREKSLDNFWPDQERGEATTYRHKRLKPI